MSGPELKNCPFCGAELIIGKQRIASCKTEGCMVQHRAVDLDYPKHIAAWNTRTPDPAQIRADALREAAARVSKMRILYQIECGRYDPTTGVTEYPGTGDEWISDMEDIEQAILALLDTPLSPTAVDGSPAQDAGSKGGV